MSKPIFAIVGRPNVGKSTLFNKIIGQRISIVEDTPGVTRDRIFADGEWSGKKFTLIDTGGIEPKNDSEILTEMRNQANLAIEMADVVIFMVDIKDGLTAADADVAAMLQKSKKPVVLVCNKSDSPGDVPMEYYEFFNLGLDEPVAVSSIHGLGVGDLLDKVYSYVDFSKTDEIEEDIIKVAVIGKPNVGKSSLINTILGEKRVIVSNVAGTTRDAIDTYYERDGQKYLFVDTAGMRKKGKIEENIERYSVIRSLAAIDRCDVVLVMIDATEGVTEQDSKIAGYAHNAGKASIVVVNKWDLVEKETNTMKNFKNDVLNGLPFMQYAPSEFVSAKTGLRLNKLFELIKFVNAQNAVRIPTGVLNDVLNDATSMVQPPSDKGRRLKIYYITQASTRPPTFILFVNDKELAHFSYVRYIENKIREAFNLNGTPVKFIIRERGEKND
ncbi:ribosome biogenesis GTPase Der [Qingrenia yutianensis]|uniref:GTPase Der n=1 Tax=Qingrenia yutianensis TaxID=2763676 RepID=A0A926FDC0_9FIRM|nr:ribosome biogenesis GTPase Der [Qingrenia yutianensis]MBC8596389.1 ribosome biogenesis GTPase Der [Qingrenia yutianensis]